MNSWDVVIIGSGLGGLSCGAILSKEGKRVCVVEKQAAPGGCLRSFTRNGRLFDTGIHYVGSMDEGQMLNHFLRYCGVYDRLRLRRLDDDGFDVIHLAGRRFPFRHGYEGFTEALSEAFPRSREDIARYAAAIAAVGSVIGVDKLRQGVISSGGLRYMSVAASSEIERLIGDPLLRRVVAGTSFLYDGIRGRTPFYHHAMINHSYIHGACRFVDGSQQLADALCEVIRRNGSEVRCRETVTAVLHRDNRVQGVRLASGEELRSPLVVSDIHPAQLLPLVGPGSRIRPSFGARIRAIPNSFGVFSLFATVDPKAFPYLNRNHYLVEGDEVWSDAERRHLPRIVMLSMQAHSADDGCEGVTLLAPMSYSEVEGWEGTSVGCRGAAYEEFKQAAAARLTEVAEAHFPGFRRAVGSLDTATPLTYRDYTGIPQGAAYGLLTDCNDVLGTLLGPSTRLGGLYLTGQNVAVHGALGVVMTALATCGAILGNEYVARKISEIG